MIRSNDTYNGVNFLRYDPPKGMQSFGCILYLHGIGERGNDTASNPSIIERNEIPKQMATMDVPWTVIAPQLPTSMGGWYENITDPMVEFVSTIAGHKHLTGISLGGMRVPVVLEEHPGVFDSASTVCGSNDVVFMGSAAMQILTTELCRIPSIHYYDPLDKTIEGGAGYSGIKSLCDSLAGKADITLQKINLPGPDHHSIWPIAYQQQNFWTWLNSKVSVPVSDPVISWNLTNGILIGTTQSGKALSISPDSIKP